MSNTLTTEQFIKKAMLVHGNKYNYSKTIYGKNHLTKVIIICPYHGEFLQSPNGHLVGDGCRKCFYESKNPYHQRISQEEWINRSILMHRDLYDYSKVIYNRWLDKVTIICKKCGHQFLQLAYMHIAGRGCPKCKISHGELEIYKWLKENNIDFVWQYIFNDCVGIKNKLKFDFYLPHLNIIIEFDGSQHEDPERFFNRFKMSSELRRKRIENLMLCDIIKNQYCQINNINLIRIPYKQRHHIKNILNSNILNKNLLVLNDNYK